MSERPSREEAAEILALLAKEAVVHAKEEVSQVQPVQRICYCNRPESYDANLVGCDGKRCARGWFHWKCVGLTAKPRTKKWYCEDCQLLG